MKNVCSRMVARRFRWLASVAVAIVAAAWIFIHERREAGFAYGVFRHHESHDGIEILGDVEFTGAIKDALKLLQMRSPTEYALVHKYVGCIVQGPHCEADVFASPPTIMVDTTTAFASRTWCCCAIAHEGYHVWLYHDFLSQRGGPVPSHVWRNQPGELACIAFEVQVGKNVGAPESELDCLRQQDGLHFDMDGDGKDTWYDRWLAGEW